MRIDDSGFGVEMREFPAMGLPEDQLKEKFPSGQMIRQMSRRGESVPSDLVERAIYGDAEAVYAAKVENKAAVGAVGTEGAVAVPTHDDKAVMNGAPGDSSDTAYSPVGAGGNVRDKFRTYLRSKGKNEQQQQPTRGLRFALCTSVEMTEPGV